MTEMKTLSNSYKGKPVSTRDVKRKFPGLLMPSDYYMQIGNNDIKEKRPESIKRYIQALR